MAVTLCVCVCVCRYGMDGRETKDQTLLFCFKAKFFRAEQLLKKKCSTLFLVNIPMKQIQRYKDTKIPLNKIDTYLLSD